MQVALQSAQVAEMRCGGVEEVPGPERLVISVDGAMVPLVGGEWRECKTLVIGEPRVTQGAEGERVVRSEHLSYFSRSMEAETFKWQVLVEIERRGVGTAKAVASVSDGAEWIQRFVDFHRPDAIRILDMPHVGEHVNQVAQAVYGEGTAEAQGWWHTQMRQLKEEGPAPMLGELRRLCEAQPECSLLSDNLAYLQKREGQMLYPAYQADGWPLGSGSAESANKLLVEDRLKGSGMHWADEHVNPLLALRNTVFNDRWDEDWPQIVLALRQQALQRRFERQQKRHGQQEPIHEVAPHLEAETRSCAPATAPADQPPPKTSTEAKPKGPHRPAPDHPWRHAPVGKARYEPWRPYQPPKT